MPTLDPFLDDLPIPSIVAPRSDDGTTRTYEVAMRNGARKVHSQLPASTPFWGYEGMYPGPTIEVPRDRNVVVTFRNCLDPPSDPANPRTQWPFGILPDDPGGMPYFVPPSPWTVVHLHGSPTRPEYDGWADNAYFANEGATHHYPCQERAALLWYHDHANMVTRLNVYAGLAGLYVVRNAAQEASLPQGAYELPLVLQDRDFEVRADADEFTGRFLYQSLTSNNKFEPAYFLVNGVVNPFKRVERTVYRLRILNGANSRFFRLAFRVDSGPLSTAAWQVIGVDGGFMSSPLNNPKTRTPGGMKEMIVLAPAERLDALVDFSQFAAGTNVELAHARPNGTYSKPIMQFQVQGAAPVIAATAPAAAPSRSPRLASSYSAAIDNSALHHATAAPIKRTIGLYVRDGMQSINGLMFHDQIEERPVLDTEEIWEFLNVTGDDHPIHLHLVNFEVIDRQTIQVVSTDPNYLANFHAVFRNWLADPSPSKPRLPPGLDFAPGSSPIPADDYEREPKDTVRVTTNSLTRIKTKFRIHLGLYMYHCHILEHEDMEMMRPMVVVPAGMPEMAHGGSHAPLEGHTHHGHSVH
jgi:o-aminophenol oxidase